MPPVCVSLPCRCCRIACSPGCRPCRRRQSEGRGAMSEAVATQTPSPKDAVVRCDACPVLCRIQPGKAGACDRYANVEGVLTRVEPQIGRASCRESVCQYG